jgi:bifunctional DNA-binding transcriptional regulator/antitoxin component of YhaV-PrlF toxin-antitoxin module
MKILKEKSREYKGKAYYKYKVNIPETIIMQSGLKDGDELEVKVENNKIVLKKAENIG